MFNAVIGTFLVRVLLRLCYRVRVRMAPTVNRGGPWVFASNHRSFFDPVLVGAFVDLPLCYFARASLWRLPVVGQVLRFYHALPIDRDEPQMAVMRRIVERLRQGRGVVIFPEGTRTRTGRLGRLRQGPALFARRAGVGLVPVYIHRSDQAWPRGAVLPHLGGCRLEVRYGPPLYPPAGLPRRLHDRYLTGALERWLVRQERELRGSPS